jgi:hypothetical protein
MKWPPPSLNDYPGFAANAAKLFGLAALAVASMALIDALRGRWEVFGADMGGTLSFLGIAWLARRRARRPSQPSDRQAD